MTDISKTQGSGDDTGSDLDSDSGLDLDFDFDLEALAAGPPVDTPTTPEAPLEPEVVIFSRGSVVEAPVESPVEAEPLPAPPQEPEDAELMDLDDDPFDPEAEIEDIFSEPVPEPVPVPEWVTTLPPRRDEPVTTAPAVSEIAEEIDLPPDVEEPAATLPPAVLPPRRGEAVAALPRTLEPDRQNDRLPQRKKPSAKRRAPTQPLPALEELPQSDPAFVEEAVVSDEASKALWGSAPSSASERAPAGNERRKRPGLVAKLKALPRSWLLIGGAVGAVVVTVLVLLSGGDGGGDGKSGAAVAGSPPEKGADPLPAAGKAEPLDQTAALNAITASTPEARILAQYSELASESARRFFSADTVEEMLLVVRDPERVEPLMREFYARNPLRSKEFTGLNLSAGDDHMHELHVFWRAKVDVKEDGRNYVIFEQLKSGARKAFLVDWETTVNYNPMRWDAFAAECPAEPMAMRVLCTLSTEYRAPFTDESKYVAFLLTHFDGAAEVRAYAERDSAVGLKLLAIAEDDYEVPFYLNLRFAPDSKESVEILGIVEHSVDWIVVQ